MQKNGKTEVRRHHQLQSATSSSRKTSLTELGFELTTLPTTFTPLLSAPLRRPLRHGTAVELRRKVLPADSTKRDSEHSKRRLEQPSKLGRLPSATYLPQLRPARRRPSLNTKIYRSTVCPNWPHSLVGQNSVANPVPLSGTRQAIKAYLLILLPLFTN